MKNPLYFPSYAEFIQRSEMLKNRQERLIQVRQNEKKKAAEALDKMKTRAQEEYENTERYIMSEICELHSKELAAMRQVYEECIEKINEEHYNKAVLPKGVQSRTSIRASTDKNVLQKKSPVKTIIICEDSQEACATNAKRSPVRNYGNSDRMEQKRNPSPTKKSVGNDDRNKVEIRTTSIYHEKCVPLLQKSTSPKKKSVPVKSIQATTNSNVNMDQMNKKTFSIKSIQTTPNLIIVDEDLINKITKPTTSTFLTQSTEDFLNSYTQRVHDRIRILEQKERMLQRRAVLLPEFIRPAIIPNTKDHVTKSTVRVTEEICESAECKKSATSKTDAECAVENAESSRIPISVATNTEADVNVFPKRTCSTAVQTSRSCKKSRRCKRASLNRNEDMVIYIRNRQNEVSHMVENKIPSNTVEHVSSNTSRETESSVSETEKISVSVEKLVHTTSNEGRKRLPGRKLDNWRRLFINGEKLSESSYYSPPDPSRTMQKLVSSRKSNCKRRLSRKDAIDDCDKDIGYYVAKLLLMSPESVENLNSIIDETVSSLSADEVTDEKPELPHSDEDDSIDEEEFLRRVLEVSIPNRQTADEETPPPVASPSRVRVSLDASSTIVETDIKSGTSSMTLSENLMPSPGDNCSDLKDAATTNLKLDSKLSGWIGASIRRTLEASAVNSTSSYDEHDSVRQVDQLVRSLIEKNEYFLSSEKSSSSNTRFSFSPVAVPDVHLNVPRLSGTSS